MTEKSDYRIFDKMDERLGFVRATCLTLAVILGNKGSSDDLPECEFDWIVDEAGKKLNEMEAMIDQLRKAPAS